MESESDIPFAGLAELVTPLLAHLDEIPEVQADCAARRAGARAGGARGPLHGPRRAALAAGPRGRRAAVLAVVDDTQWLDEPSLEAFLFAGRRLGQEGVAMLGAVRDDAPRLEVPWLERLRRAAAR